MVKKYRISKYKQVSTLSCVSVDDINESDKTLYKKLLSKFTSEFDDLNDEYDVIVEATLIPEEKSTRLDPGHGAYFEDFHVCLFNKNQTETITELLTKKAKQNFEYWLGEELKDY